MGLDPVLPSHLGSWGSHARAGVGWDGKIEPPIPVPAPSAARFGSPQVRPCHLPAGEDLTALPRRCLLCRQNSPEYKAVLSGCHQRAANSIVHGAILNGGLYIKLGQGLCALNHLLPPEYITTLRVLEDKALKRGYKEVRLSLAKLCQGTESGA